VAVTAPRAEVNPTQGKPARVTIDLTEVGELTADSNAWEWRVYLNSRLHPERKELIATADVISGGGLPWRDALAEAEEAVADNLFDE
jgi:hypothetical protein